MRSEVLTAEKIQMLVFWVVMPCRIAGDTNVSDEHTASIFRAIAI